MENHKELEKICEDCKKIKDELMVSAEMCIEWNKESYSEWVKRRAEIIRRFIKISNKYFEVAINEKNPVDLIQGCKECYAGTLVSNTMMAEQKYQINKQAFEISERFGKR